MDIQARVLPALAALHNFILRHDSEDDILDMEVEDPAPGARREEADFGVLAGGATTSQGKARSEAKRDAITNAMWQSYQTYLRQMPVAHT